MQTLYLVRHTKPDIAPGICYGQLDMEMWRAVRLVVDSGIHAMGWSRAEAIAFMAGHVTLPPEAIAAEVDRYIGWPGQASCIVMGTCIGVGQRAGKLVTQKTPEVRPLGGFGCA